MKRSLLLNPTLSLTLLLLLIISGCKKDEDPIQSPASFTGFSFLRAHNPDLDKDIYPDYDGYEIRGILPPEADPGSLVASFAHEGSVVQINGVVQHSGETANDFSDVVTYEVTGEDGKKELFEVDMTWFTGLPMIYITTENKEEISSLDEYLQGSVKVMGNRHHGDVSGEMEIRGRGHSTWYVHPKKPYQLKFGEKTGMLDMPPDKKWIFLAEHSDKTLIRNNLAFELGALSRLDWTPQNVYAEVFVNDDYRGTYLITQKVEAGSNRVDIGESGFLLELDVIDHIEPGDIYFFSSRFLIQIKDPEIEPEGTVFNAIRQYIMDFEEALYSDEFTDPLTGYKRYADMESFVEWYLVNEIAKNQDAKDYSSMYCHLKPGEKLKMGPLWDFDLGFGNVNYSECEFPEGFWVKDHAWISRMFEDPEFVSHVIERFDYFRNNQDYLLEFIDQSAAQLKIAQRENDERWDVFGNWIWPNPVVYDTHEEEVEHLKGWLTTRMDWLEQAYAGLRSNSTGID